MSDIYFPISTTTLANSPVVNITVDNESTINLVTLDERGFVGKTPLSLLRENLKVNSLNELNDIINPNKILGRYSSNTGPIEEISLGTGLSVTNGVLNCDITFSGTAGGDLEGSFPNPTIKEGVITLSNFTGLSNNKLLGRFSQGTGEIEEISLGTDFELVNGQLNLINTNSVSLTGFVMSEKTDDFTAEPTHLYYVDSTKNITVSVGNGVQGDQFIIINKSEDPNVITINFPNETILMDSLTKKVGYFIRDNNNNFFDLNI